MLKRSVLMVPLLAIVFTGCGSSDEKINIDYSQLKQAAIKDAPLVKTSVSDFERFLKNGIRLRLAQQGFPVALATAAEGDGASLSGQFSSTNTHELNVDEADRVKYDGEYVYHVVEGSSSSSTDSQNLVRISKSNPQDASLEIVSEISNDSADLQVTDLYLRSEQSQLVAIKKTIYTYWDAFLSETDWQWQSGKAEIQLFDIQNSESPIQQWGIEIEGNLEGSRRIGNMLYLITRYVPNIQTINYSATTDADKRINERIILDTPISDLLPHYQINNGAVRPLVAANNCFVSQDVAPVEGYADVVTLSAIDLDTQQLTSSACLNANVSGIYASTDSLYIGGSAYAQWFDFSQFTVVHKFKLDADQVSYRASKAVPGYLGWNDPAFRMSEYQDDLRIITTSYVGFSGSPNHQLNILREDGSNQLQQISRLPNADFPETIGKTGEELFAVRFSGERAYAVTFQQIDPLYVLDLSDPQAPQIVGELEIPGFSRYLHPLSTDWLLGIGTQVEDGIQQGVKVELYDLRDMTNPLVKNTLVFGERGSTTEANYDLRSISFLNISEQSQRFALPISIYRQAENAAYSSWKESGLYQFELQTQSDGSLEMSLAGGLTADSASEQRSWPLAYSGQRAVLHDDAVFFLYGDEFFTGLWGQTLPQGQVD